MTAQTFLGIDAGGTHTDAVLCGPEGILAGLVYIQLTPPM